MEVVDEVVEGGLEAEEAAKANVNSCEEEARLTETDERRSGESEDVNPEAKCTT